MDVIVNTKAEVFSLTGDVTGVWKLCLAHIQEAWKRAKREQTRCTDGIVKVLKFELETVLLWSIRLHYYIWYGRMFQVLGLVIDCC